MPRLRIAPLMLLLLASSLLAGAQTRTFTKDDIAYVMELPSPAWQVVSRLDVHDHLEFMYGDDATDGYLRLRKILVEAGTTSVAIFRRDEKWDLQRLPGYVVCSEGKGQRFGGALNGVVFTYEYVRSGKQMCGRVYYLQVDQRTFYSLRFTVACDKQRAVRDQMEMIARSFRLKG